MGYTTLCFSENPFISNTYGLTKGSEKVFNSWKLGGKWWWIEKKTNSPNSLVI